MYNFSIAICSTKILLTYFTLFTFINHFHYHSSRLFYGALESWYFEAHTCRGTETGLKNCAV